jgi:hypothetical protein
VPRRVKGRDVVVDHSLAAECELGNEGSKDIVRWFNRAKALCPSRDVFKTKADVVKFVQEAVADGAK